MDKKINLLITGGAGFIGSNLVEHFLEDERVGLVRVLDNLSNGYIENIQEFFDHPRFEFIEGDIRSYETCLKACEGIDKISHQAALGSVPRSIENPMQSTEVNILGTVNLMYAAVQQKVERIILAFSSSTYGDHPDLPKVEENIGNPLSPYAVTKAAIEQFADIFGKTYGLKWIGFRYFNVFGPRQSPNNPYAAVIPLFIKAAITNADIKIYGDGETSRDFTFVSNVVHANSLALFSENKRSWNQVYNVSCGAQTSLVKLAGMIISMTKSKSNIHFQEERIGDVKHSLGDIMKIQDLLDYKVKDDIEIGLKKLINSWI
ncbi:GDP-mannose 4,6-dehydratase [Schleiferiaceae bacterium]|nr:GDP-mannose 4,6-dehydratase [Schleiferiaceae bacterium]